MRRKLSDKATAVSDLPSFEPYSPSETLRIQYHTSVMVAMQKIADHPM